MSDIPKAQELLYKGDFTCVLCKDDIVYVSKKKGISPMLDFITNGIDLSGFSVADKIVGKAAAMLFVKAGVREVFGEVVSKEGLSFLQSENIPCSYKILTENIINRKGDGICPMENEVKNISDTDIAYDLLIKKRNELRGIQI